LLAAGVAALPLPCINAGRRTEEGGVRCATHHTGSRYAALGAQLCPPILRCTQDSHSTPPDTPLRSLLSRQPTADSRQPTESGVHLPTANTRRTTAVCTGAHVEPHRVCDTHYNTDQGGRRTHDGDTAGRTEPPYPQPRWRAAREHAHCPAGEWTRQHNTTAAAAAASPRCPKEGPPTHQGDQQGKRPAQTILAQMKINRR
jgi:hypothetical protein